MAIRITITGIDDALKRLDHASGNEALRRAMERSVERLRNRMADYPPQRTGSSYRRTGTLGRRWTTRVEALATGARGRVGNNTRYGPFVQSSAFQATVHRGRWQTDRQVLEEETGTIEGYFREEVQRSLDGR
jgi:hypothetical protein